MTSIGAAAFLFVFVAPTFAGAASAAAGSAGVRYRAAVVELAPTQRVATTKSEATALQLQNVAVADLWAEKAAAQGAQIIVFSEDYVDNGWVLSDKTAPLYAEQLPEPGSESLCTDQTPSSGSSIPVLRALACSAKKHGLTLVTGTADIGPCVSQLSPFTRKQYPCDKNTNRTQFNSMVALGPDGALLAKYHKSHLARTWKAELEDQWAEPDIPDIVTFDTDFGVRFGMFICNDVNFGGPARGLLKSGVRDFVFSTLWMNALAGSSAIGIQDGFSRAHGVNFIAANGDLGGRNSSGSGIWPANTSAPFVQHFNPTLRQSNGWMGVADLVSPAESPVLLAPVPHPVDSPPLAVRNASFLTIRHTITGQAFELSASSENVTCHVAGIVKGGGGFYGLVAQSGLHPGGWYSASCVLVACSTPTVEGCSFVPHGTVPWGGSVFESLSLSINARYVNTYFPTALCSNGEVPSPRSAVALTEQSPRDRVLTVRTDCPLMSANVESRAQAEDERQDCPFGGCQPSTVTLSSTKARGRAQAADASIQSIVTV